MQDEIEKAAFDWATAVDAERKIIVGLNRYATDTDAEPDVFPIDPKLEREQADRLRALRAKRDDTGVKAALEDLRAAAQGTQNLLPPMKEALRRYATLGEVSDVLRDEFGVYQPAR
jgi:methylmalonyl-CoA mutase N-terminal domain/subunit